MHKLEKLAADQNIVEINADDAVIFDGHADIQWISLPDNSVKKVTFQEMGTRFLSHILKSIEGMPSGGKGDIHVTFDRYLESSVKLQSRGKRGEDTIIVSHIQPHVSIPKSGKRSSPMVKTRLI